METSIFLKNQEYLLYLIGILVSVGVIKENKMFADLYSFIISRVKSKKATIMLVSAISGVLPVPGRVTVSAGVLDTIAPKDNKKARSKFGIIDFLSTHHYYLWSPLEKTIILPISVLGLTYWQVISYTWILLIISLAYIIWYILTQIEENDIEIVAEKKNFDQRRFVIGAVPMILSVVALIFGMKPYIIFPVLAVYYLAVTSTWSVKKILGYINWRLVFMLAFIIFASNIIKAHTDEVMSFLKAYSLGMDTVRGFVIVSTVAFGSSLLLGSSSRYSGIMVLLTTVYGLQYFTYFIALEFSGYLLSPFHKCNTIGKMYFGTPLLTYVKALGGWTALLIAYSLLNLFVLKLQ